MEHCAFITGATSGIGEAMAYELAKRKYNIFIIGRREERLKTVANTIKAMGVAVDYKSVDICDDEKRKELCAYIIEHHSIDMLVNNAGVGAFGLFEEVPCEQQLQMITLNITALVDITHRLLVHMQAPSDIQKPNTNKNNANKYIVNIASVGGFQPGAYYAVYYATKAFVISFSEALPEECKAQKNNIFVSAVCPGPTKSEFFEQAGLIKGEAIPKTLQNIPSAKSLAQYAVPRIVKKKVIIIHGIFFKMMVFFERCMPRAMIRRMTAHIQKQKI